MHASSAAGRAAFDAAVTAYALRDLAPPANVLAAASGSLVSTGLFLLGEAHGVEQNPRAILGLASRLGVRSLAFEWSHDELDAVVQPVLSAGTVDSDALWMLPATAEVFSGDGRFTAGHVRLLERLSSRLERIVLLDRSGSDGPKREHDMARRLLHHRRPDAPLLAILGAGHVVRAAHDVHETLGSLVEREVPGVANGMLLPSAGTLWFHGERELSSGELPPTDAVFPVGAARPAVVPRRHSS